VALAEAEEPVQRPKGRAKAKAKGKGKAKAKAAAESNWQRRLRLGRVALARAAVAREQGIAAPMAVEAVDEAEAEAEPEAAAAKAEAAASLVSDAQALVVAANVAAPAAQTQSAEAPPLAEAAPQSEAAVPAQSAFETTQCYLCGELTEKFGWNLRNKKRGHWICKGCNVSRVVFAKNNMDPEFSFQSPEEVQEFWLACKALDNNAKLELVRSTTKVHSSSSMEHYQEGGSFLPLSVWKTKGFDIEAIEALSKPCDKEKHPVLGDTYRVSIVSMSLKRKHGETFSDTMHVGPSPRPNQPPEDSTADTPKPTAKPTDLKELIALQKAQRVEMLKPEK